MARDLRRQHTAVRLSLHAAQVCLKGGKRWEDGFVNGLLSSVLVVPVLSTPLLRGFEKLSPYSRCDNVLRAPLPAAKVPWPLRLTCACDERQSSTFWRSRRWRM